MYKYTCVLLSNNFQNASNCLQKFVSNSSACSEVLVYWNGASVLTEPLAQIASELTSRYNIHVKVIPSEKDVYEMYNDGVAKSANPYVLLINDDMYFPFEWDKEVSVISQQPFDPSRTVVTFSLVEPGYVSVNEKNIHKDFGQSWETFNQVGFDSFSQESTHYLGNGLGWYMPVIFPCSLFIEYGGYPTRERFPHPNDILFFTKLEASAEVKFVKIDSRVYHFQRLSQRKTLHTIEHDRLNLCCGDDKRIDYLNVDFQGSDFDLDVSKAQFPWFSNSFSEVLFRHALEHFRYEVGIEILKEIYRVTKKGGFVTVHVPNLELACEDLLLGYNQYPGCASAINRIYGLNTSEHQVHKWGYTKSSLKQTLMQVGFTDIVILETGIADEIAVRGTK